MRQRHLAFAGEGEVESPEFLFRSSVHEIPYCVAGAAVCRPVRAFGQPGRSLFPSRLWLRAIVLRAGAFVRRAGRVLRCRADLRCGAELWLRAELLRPEVLPSPVPLVPSLLPQALLCAVVL